MTVTQNFIYQAIYQADQCEQVPAFQQYFGNYVAYEEVLPIIKNVFLQHFCLFLFAKPEKMQI